MDVWSLLIGVVVLWALYRLFVNGPRGRESFWEYVKGQNALRDWIQEQGGIHQLESDSIEQLEKKGFSVNEYYENGISLKKKRAHLSSEVQVLYGQDRERSVHIEIEIDEVYDHDDTIRSRREVETGVGVVGSLERLVEGLIDGFIDDPNLQDAVRQHFALPGTENSSDSDTQDDKPEPKGVEPQTGYSVPKNDWRLVEGAYAEEDIEAAVMDRVIQDLYKEDGLHPSKIQTNHHYRNEHPNTSEAPYDFSAASPPLVNYLTAYDEKSRFSWFSWDVWFIDAYPDALRWFLSHGEDTLRRLRAGAGVKYGTVGQLSLEQKLDFYRRMIDRYQEHVSPRLEGHFPDGWASRDIFTDVRGQDTFSLNEIFPCLSLIEVKDGEIKSGIRTLTNGTYPTEGTKTDKEGDEYRWHNFMVCLQSDFARMIDDFGLTEEMSWQTFYDMGGTSSQFERDLDYEIGRGNKCRVTAMKQEGEVNILTHTVVQ